MLKFENATNGRYYYIYVERDLLGDYLLVIHRGGLQLHTIRRRGFRDEYQLQKEIDKLSKRRIARGYTLIQ